MLPHCPAYEAGVHYVESAPEDLATTILHYLKHPAERERIVENAYQLLTTRLTLHNTIKLIMCEVERVQEVRSRK
jgi:spore maturation protein CgeB